MVGGSGWEGVATGKDEGAGGAHRGGGVGVIVASAAVGEFINTGCLEVVGSVSADAVSAEIVCEDEDDVRLG